MSSPSTTDTSSPSTPTSSTRPSPAPSAPKKTTPAPDFDPFHAFKQEMRAAHEARVIRNSAYIREVYGREAAFKYEMGAGVIHWPSLITFAFGKEKIPDLSGGWQDVQMRAKVEEKVKGILEMEGEKAQRVLDGMACETEGERKVWAMATRRLRQMRNGGCGVRISRGSDQE